MLRLTCDYVKTDTGGMNAAFILDMVLQIDY